MLLKGSRIIVAADYDSLEPAIALAKQVGPHVFGIKVGSELAEAVGAPQAVGAIMEAGSGVFRDLKTFDIKNTDVKTMAASVRAGVVIVNMHALNGSAKMKASADAVRTRAKELSMSAPLVLAVTILTDFSWDELKEMGFFADQPADLPVEDKTNQLRELVVKLARSAQDAGLDGVIASPQEATLIRKACGAGFVIATPGIRPADAPPDDQKRTLTPSEAIEAGADLLVIGRPITGAADPLAVVKQFNADIETALAPTGPSFPKPSLRVLLPPPPKPTDEVYLAALHDCGGYYQTPVGFDGKPLGPLVGYSGRYTDDSSGHSLQYVGTRYFNLATLEQFPHVANFFASGLAAEVVASSLGVDCIVGVPEGGLILGHNTASCLDVLYAGLQKKIVALATDTSKEQTRLVLGRHDIESGMRVVLCEDLVNNFSTTDKAIAVVEAVGATVVALVCGLNRSDRSEYNGLPVISLVHLSTPQYRQDDPLVAPYLENPGVVYDVKPNWARLKQAMAEHAGLY